MDISNLENLDIDQQKIINNFSTNWINIAIVIAITIAVVFAIKFFSKRINKAIDKKIDADKKESRGRAHTLTSVISKLLISLSIITCVLIILNQLGISITPIVAIGAIALIIIGIGAQSVIKDVINGAFILIEQWFQVGDIVAVSGDINISGRVEKINMRTTVLRDLNGIVHHIPNSEIRALSNKTQEWANAVVEVGVHYRENTDRVVEVFETVFDELVNDEKYKKTMLERPKVLGNGGVNELGDSSVTFKIICKVKAEEQWTIERQLRKRIKDKFDEVGIEIPYPCRNLYMR
jgi:small conductance mechanosensitive channel